MCDFNLALVIKDRRPAHAATVVMLPLCSWEKNDICLILIPGAALGRVEACLKSYCFALNQVGLFLSLFFFRALPQSSVQAVVALEANWAKGPYWRIRLCRWSGDWTRRAGPQRRTSCCRDTRVPVWCPSVWHVFFFLFLQFYQFGWLSTRATLKEPTGGCGLAKADRLLASYCWFSTLVHCDRYYSTLRCGLQYGEWRLEASQEWNWTINSGVAGYVPSFCPHCEGLDSSFQGLFFFFLCWKKTPRSFLNSESSALRRRMKLRKQVTVCGGAIFCVAVFSLYLMLDRVQHDPARRQNGGNFPRVRVIAVEVVHTVHMMIWRYDSFCSLDHVINEHKDFSQAQIVDVYIRPIFQPCNRRFKAD